MMKLSALTETNGSGECLVVQSSKVTVPLCLQSNCQAHSQLQYQLSTQTVYVLQVGRKDSTDGRITKIFLITNIRNSG